MTEPLMAQASSLTDWMTESLTPFASSLTDWMIART
jgi:hypothetical protein